MMLKNLIISIALTLTPLFFSLILPSESWYFLLMKLSSLSRSMALALYQLGEHHASLKLSPLEGSNWNIHHFLGGIGPWMSSADEHYIQGDTPPGCEVEQVHMIARHAARFPTTKAGDRILHLLSRLQDPYISLTGDLAFVQGWKLFTSNPQADFEQLTRTGPYAGTLAAFASGVNLRTRYANLINDRYQHSNGTLNIWASDSGRVIDTAKYFSAGLLGLDWNQYTTLHVIPETLDRGADTLTPGKTCLAYINDLEQGRERGYIKLAEFTGVYTPSISNRLEKFISHKKSRKSLKLSNMEVYTMQELCGFEILSRGSSPWCNLFTREDWAHFAHARDLLHYYRAGPGSPYSFVMGGLYLNATGRLLDEGPDAGKLFFSFVHDGDIAPVLSALHILHNEQPLPSTHVEPTRKWKTSHLMPMGARIIFERLRCHKGDDSSTTNVFVRLSINDGIVTIPGCDSGKGLCPIDDFMARIRQSQEEAGDFRVVCGLTESDPAHITFLKQKN